MMKLYDEVIGDLSELLKNSPCRALPIHSRNRWKDVGGDRLIFRGDMAYELGGGGLPALGCTMPTMETSLVQEDSILLYGSDLGDIRKDTPYARIAAVRVRQDSMGEGNALYNAVCRLEYTKYHLFPEGYMMRISAAGEREMVRIGRQALRKGLGFAQVGNLFLEAYHRHPEVEAVKLLFITGPDFPYQRLEALVKKAEQITKAVDHITKNLTMDCGTCSLKQICDEVEDLKKLHFT